MKITYDQLLKSIQEKKYPPVVLMHGPEVYFIDQLSKLIEETALTPAEQSFNQQVMYGKDTNADNLLAACRRYPMMAPIQVIILKEAQQLSKFESLEEYLKNPVPTTLLVLCHKYKNLDKRLKLYKIVEGSKSVALYDATKLQDKQLPEWIVAYLKERKLSIRPQAVSMLAEYIGNDLETLSNALDKLTLASEEGSQIDEKDIEKHVGISREYNIFELQSALARRDRPKLAKIVDYMAKHPKEAPMPMILGVLYPFFAKILALQRDPKNPRGVGIWDNALQEYQLAAKAFDGKVPYAMQMLQEFDLRFKGVDDPGTDESELLKELVYRLSYL